MADASLVMSVDLHRYWRAALPPDVSEQCGSARIVSPPTGPLSLQDSIPWTAISGLGRTSKETL